MRRSRALALAALATVLACGDEREGGRSFDGGPTYPPASVEPRVAFEGHGRMAVAIEAPSGADFSDATVAPVDPSGPLEILEQRCNAARCGVVLRILDQMPNRGVAIPQPIDAENQFLAVRRGGDEWRALLTVRPLDTLRGAGTEPVTVRGTTLASGIQVDEGAILRGGDAPVRWVVFGGGAISGRIDVSAEGAEGRAGGAAGGAADAAGEGKGPGDPGGAGGAGGAGHAEVGGTGTGADGTEGEGAAGGMAYGEPPIACGPAFAEAACGGSGGGGAVGEGGGGGGTLFIAALETLDVGGATLSASGGDGDAGGGGGSGGHLFLAGPDLAAPAEATVGGGAGGTDGAVAGGAGSAGRIRIDTDAVADLGPAWRGPAVDVTGLSQLTDSATLTLMGRSTPESEVTVERFSGGVSATVTANAEGAWSVDLTLEPGLNRLRVTASGPGWSARSWTGTSFEFAGTGPNGPMPVGGTVDVVYVD